MRKIIYPPTKTNHIYWEGGIEMAPRNGSTNMMSKSCQYFVFYFVKEVQLYSNDFERVGYSNALTCLEQSHMHLAYFQISKRK
jgi:hypothetical protein